MDDILPVDVGEHFNKEASVAVLYAHLISRSLRLANSQCATFSTVEREKKVCCS